jgi:myo-inositol-1(or 4)-monophosphatase
MKRLSINDLRRIGARLREILPRMRFAKDAGRVLQRGASGDKTFQIDRVAEETVFSMLKEMGIPLTLVSEEMGVVEIKGGGDRVLIDPIDGSKNAVSGIPMFCTSIAVSESKRLKDLRLAYVLNILTGDEYWAVRGEGSYLNGRPINVDSSTDIKVVLYETQTPGRDVQRILPLLALANRTRCFGSTALDLCFLAMGAASVYINPALTRSFDFAAGVLIVKEAGGVVTSLTGEEVSDMELSMKKTSPLLVSANAEIHQKVLQILKE